MQLRHGRSATLAIVFKLRFRYRESSYHHHHGLGIPSRQGAIDEVYASIALLILREPQTLIPSSMSLSRIVDTRPPCLKLLEHELTSVEMS